MRNKWQTVCWILVPAFIMIMGAWHTALAAGTASGTSIQNEAKVDYEVGGVAQDQVSGSASFLVDNKVDLSVTTIDVAIVEVVPGSTAQVLTFAVQNDGNTVQDYSLAAADSADGAFGETESFDATNVHEYVESGANSGYQADEDTAEYIDELAADSSATVYIVADIPLVQGNGDVASYDLIVQTAQGGTSLSQGADITTDDSANADVPGAVQIVFADADGTADDASDGKYSSKDGYKVVTSMLSVSKSSIIISDPFTTTGNFKAIPGAIVEYTITITNDVAAGATATSIEVSDSLNAEITAGSLAFEADTYGVGYGIQVTAPNINGGAALSLTNAGDADVGDYNSTAANTVTVTGIELDADEQATITFRVEIQ